MNNKKNTLQIVVGSLLVLLLIGVTVLLISEKRTNNELVQEFNLEKDKADAVLSSVKPRCFTAS